ncbi:MAG: COX15/CtaA family protein [Bacteroidetes bacterium]|nr:COX15/CtaA family protein [Bacteroidota bacterium]
MFNNLLYRYSIFLLVSVLILICAGALVTSTQSGLAVPDWPNTFGYNMFTFPISKWVGGIYYEHLHRLVASSVGFFIIILVFLTHKFDKRKWVKKLSLYLLLVVCFQGLLGGLTVLFLLPDLISTFHATLAQLFFCLVITNFVVQTKWWHNVSENKIENLNINHITKLSLTVFLIILLQLIFGAWMRHTESGLAIPDFPLAYGQIIPSLENKNLESYNNYLFENNFRIFADGQITKNQIIYNMLHRSWAYVVAIGILILVYKLKKYSHKNFPKIFTKLKLILIFLIISQVALGIFTILSRKSVLITTSHVVIGATILGIVWSITLILFRIKFVQNSKLSL